MSSPDLIVHFPPDESEPDLPRADGLSVRVLQLGAEKGRVWCVSASDEFTRSLRSVECREDLLKSVYSANAPFTQSTHLRLLHSHLRSILPAHLSIFPLHDAGTAVPSVSSPARTPASIRDTHGEEIAFYFHFLGHYTSALVIPSILGASTYFLGLSFSAWYAVPMLLWAVGTLEVLDVRQRQLAVDWGVYGCSRVSGKFAAPNFVGKWYVGIGREYASVPIMAGMILALAGVLVGLFMFEAFINPLYTGVFRDYISYAPLILFTVTVPRLLQAYKPFLRQITSWEGHRSASSFERSLTLKTFLLNSMVAYGPLILTSFVYIPFCDVISVAVTDWVNPAMKSSVAIEAQAGRMHAQIFAAMVTGQIVNTFSELALPYFTRRVTIALKKEKEIKGKSEDFELIKLIETQLQLPEYSTFEDYGELATQFGFVTIFSVAWPLSPLCALVNNKFEQNSDLLKLRKNFRRTVPRRVDGWGRSWGMAFTAMIYVGSIMNAYLIYMFSPVYGADAAAKKLGSAFVAVGLRNKEGVAHGAAMLVPALLLAFFAEHAFFIVQKITRQCVRRALWYGSPQQIQINNLERTVKIDFLQGNSLEKSHIQGASTLTFENPKKK